MTILDQDERGATETCKMLEYHATVRDMPRQEQPRERLRQAGPQALSVAELLAIVLGRHRHYEAAGQGRTPA